MTAPVPIERKRALGNPGKRALPKPGEIAIIGAVAEPPVDLGEKGLEAWNRILDTARAWTGATDFDLLAAYCTKVDRHAEMVEQLSNSNNAFILFTDKGYAYANPLVGMISTIESEMVKMLSLLGLTPTDRSRLGLAEVKAQSTLEKLKALKDAK
jgi:P27 family predicted phage terminase small subunit